MEVNAEKWPFVFTGPQTIAGRYLRKFWQPVYESDDLSSGESATIEVFSEKFTLYRDSSGVPRLVANKCPHRGTQLSSGWVEGDGIRCFYHGWKFNGEGQCIEQPAEPKPFCEKIAVSTYPTVERFGLIFCYLGGGRAPSLLGLPQFESDNVVSSIVRIPCNYFQSAENIIDDVHVGFAHRAAPELGRSQRGVTPPRVRARETSFGLTVNFRSESFDAENHFIMPNSCYVSYDLVYGDVSVKSPIRMHTLFWYVPIDDVSHRHVMVSTGPPLIVQAMRSEKLISHSVAGEIADVLNGNSNFHKEYSPSRVRKPNLIRIQDGVTIVGQGQIASRDNEHLGASDAGVVLLRRLWKREIGTFLADGTVRDFSGSDNLAKIFLVSPGARGG